MQTLNQDIKNHTFQRAYLICGEEVFLKNSYKKKMMEAILDGDTMNFAAFEGKGIDVEEVIRLADTMPFFAEHRLILIENSGFFKSGCEALLTYLPQMPDTTCMIFVESEVDKRSKLYKKIKELGYIAEMNRQDSVQLARWAGAILAKAGKKITGRTMELFLSMSEKLISYTGEKEVITDEDVRAICTPQVTNRIFEMVSAIAGRQPHKAMDLYEDLLTLKEPPMRILFLIARQFNQILQVKELMEKRMDRSAIASALKLQPFVVGKTMPQARQFTRDQILSYVNLCVDAEEAVKSGRLQDRLAVELLIAKEY